MVGQVLGAGGGWRKEEPYTYLHSIDINVLLVSSVSRSVTHPKGKFTKVEVVAQFSEKQ